MVVCDNCKTKEIKDGFKDFYLKLFAGAGGSWVFCSWKCLLQKTEPMVKEEAK